jgi:peroxiredoxin
MTHLVELQEAMPKFEAAGIRLYAISYDDQEALADFVNNYNITYTMLSDPDSRVIREYGILNTLVKPHEVPFYGIPFPGTYIIDENGRITDKFFPRMLAMRENAETFIDAALGEILLGNDEINASSSNENIRIQVSFHGGRTFKTALQRKVIVRFDLPEGLHIYGEPVPEGMVATRIEVKGPIGLQTDETISPPTETLYLEALNTKLQVWSGQVDFVVPVWAGDAIGSSDGGPPGNVELTVTVKYQACNDTNCLLPVVEKFDLSIPVADYTMPRLGNFRGKGSTSRMKSGQHMARLVARKFRKRWWLLPLSWLYLRNQKKAMAKGPAGKAMGIPR